ncbi:hypothetical protein QYF61_021852 [Mycteria americana]|uniref:Uncharacterized protein n=1 Tax=Mycteria americana TaxID=33587 RepID=A0AAN7M9J7_MYCAM|nr:hypothetical protein QYF61_021852 [Mycteria americana]
MRSTAPGSTPSSPPPWRDPQERGEPLVIKATSYSDLAAAVQKAACIQAIYERDELRKSLILAPIDPARLTALIHGLPDCLKMFVANAQDRIQAARRDAGPDRRRSQRIPIPTWSEFVQDIHRYGCRVGWISSSSVKPLDHAQRVRQVHTQNPKFNKERGELWRKALDLGVPRQILRGVSTEDLRTLVQSLGKRNNPARENCLAGKPPTHKESAPSVPDIIDKAGSQQKNLPSPGRAVSHPAQQVLAIQWLSNEYSDPIIAIPVPLDPEKYWTPERRRLRLRKTQNGHGPKPTLNTVELWEHVSSKQNLNLATVVMHGSHVFSRHEWSWDNGWLPLLKGKAGEEIQVGCRMINGSTHEKVTSMRISNISRNVIATKSCVTDEWDCWYNFTLVGPAIVACVRQQHCTGLGLSKRHCTGLSFRFKIDVIEPDPTTPPDLTYPLHLTHSNMELGMYPFSPRPYIIKNTGQQQVLFNPSYSLKQVELAMQTNSSAIKPTCSPFLSTSYTGWNGTAAVLANKLTTVTSDLNALKQPLQSSLSAPGANQWLLLHILPQWGEVNEKDHQSIADALSVAQTNISLALSRVQAQLWVNYTGR